MIRQVQKSPDLVAEINGKVRKALIEEGVGNPNDVTAEEITGFLFDTFLEGSDSTSAGMAGYLDNFAIDNSYADDGYLRTAFTSWLVGNLMGSLEFVYNAQYPAMSTVKLAPAMRRTVEILKHLNYQLTIRAPRLAVVQYRGYDLVRKIFEALTTDKGRDLLPTDARKLHDQCDNLTEQRRIVCDFIAGMTDRYAVEFYSRLYNGDQSIFKPF
jgi:dGTPase